MNALIEDIATVVIACAAVYIAYVGHSLRKRQHIVHTLSTLFEGWSDFNEKLIGNPKRQELEIELHPHGKLSPDEIVKLYHYFELLNKARVTLFRIWKNDIDIALGNADINLVANMLFEDRAFVRQHAFPRGYVHLPPELELRWRASEAREGAPLGMDEIFTLPKKNLLQRLLSKLKAVLITAEVKT